MKSNLLPIVSATLLLALASGCTFSVVRAPRFDPGTVQQITASILQTEHESASIQRQLQTIHAATRANDAEAVTLHKQNDAIQREIEELKAQMEALNREEQSIMAERFDKQPLLKVAEPQVQQ